MKEKDEKARKKKEKELEDEMDNKKSVSIALVGVFFLPGAFLAVKSPPSLLPKKAISTRYTQSLKALFPQKGHI